MNKEIIMFEELKKYFEFSGTISGTQYFLRNLVSSIGAFTAGGVIALGAIINSLVVILLGMALLIPVFWFAACNIYKRIKAFYPNQTIAFTIILGLLQLISPFGKGETWGVLLNLILLVIGLLLIFGNSKVEQHNG
jgi:uncharacterized membrane protein YhaH (DUF805 family)